MQYLSSNPRRTPGATPGENATGADVRYQWGRGLTSTLSARPDFSGIDTDVAGAGFSYTEKYVADRRPFFQDGRAFFGDREIFHSGRIEDFDVGVKTFGRVDDYQVGVLATTEADSERADYVGRVARDVGQAFNVSATVAGTKREDLENTAVQVQAGGRLGRFLQVDGQVAVTDTAGAPGDGTRERAEIAYRRARLYSGGWADNTDAGFFAADGFLPADVVGTTGRGAYTGYTRQSGQSWLRSTDASVSYQVRETQTGELQREAASVYVGANTAANVQLSAGVTTGSYRPRGPTPGAWLDVVNDDRSYQAAANYQSPERPVRLRRAVHRGLAGPQTYDSLAPNLWLAPSPHLSVGYSFERATYDQVRLQHVVVGHLADQRRPSGGGALGRRRRRLLPAQLPAQPAREHGRVRRLLLESVRAPPLRREAGVDAVGGAAALTAARRGCSVRPRRAELQLCLEAALCVGQSFSSAWRQL